MRARDRFEALDPLELALERAVVIAKFTPPNDFYRTQFAKDIAREPDFAIRAPADDAQQFVIGDGRQTVSRFLRGGHCRCHRVDRRDDALEFGRFSPVPRVTLIEVGRHANFPARFLPMGNEKMRCCQNLSPRREGSGLALHGKTWCEFS